jgi:predicted nucleotidyltransferase
MAEIPDAALLIIDQFLSELALHDIKVEQAILFGSYAKGTFDEWSDIDLALVSATFAGERFKDREKMRRIKLKVSSLLEPVPYTPEEFNADNPFIKHLLETGIRIR